MLEDINNLTCQYQKHGFVILKNLFSEEDILQLNRLVEPIYQTWLKGNESIIFKQKLLNMHSLTRPEYFEGNADKRIAFFQAITSEKLTQLLDGVFGDELYFHNTQLFFNPTNPARLPYWHRDMQYSPIKDSEQQKEQHNMLSLHVRIPLIKETGIELIAGSHKRWDTELERKVRFELEGHKNSDTLTGSSLIELALGDVLVFNAQMLHRGNYTLNAERCALDLCIGKYHAFSASFLDKSCLPTEDEMDKIENGKWYQLAHKISS